MYDVKFPIPTEVEGHPVTRRGVHWGTQWFHGPWIEGYRDRDWKDWTDWGRSMHLSWAVLLSSDDSALLPQNEAEGDAKGLSAVQVLLEAGIIPIVRFGVLLPQKFNLTDHVKTLVEQVSAYNVPAYILLGNEFGDPREWRGGEVPKDWMEQAFAWWIDAARTCLAFDSAEHRVVVGFPDGPDYYTDPFQFMKDLPSKKRKKKKKGKKKKGQAYTSAENVDAFFQMWRNGQAFYAGHFYGLNRPPDYPDDAVSREGVPLTDAEQREQLGKFYDTWKAPLDLINRQRDENAWVKHNKSRPELTACWRSWKQVADWMKLHFDDKVMPIAVTEGGWTPGAIAGTGLTEAIDDRWPKPIPETVAEYTLYAFDKEDSPIFAICPWVGAAGLMQEKGVWEGDAWRSTEYLAPEFEGRYGQDMPVVEILQKNAPPGGGPGEKPDDPPVVKPDDPPVVKPDDPPVVKPDDPPVVKPDKGPEIDGSVEKFINKGLVELDLQGDAYKLKKIIWLPPGDEEGTSKNLHHIFVDVVDDEDKRILNKTVNVSWFDGKTNAIKTDPVKIEKPENEQWGGNFPMFTIMGSFTVEVATDAGTSDKVAGLGMGTPEEPDVKHHTSFGLVFRKVEVSG